MKRNKDAEWEAWHHDKGVMYSLSGQYLTVSAAEQKIGPIRLIGGNIDATIRQACREMKYDLDNSN